jgi:hypothetical protein
MTISYPTQWDAGDAVHGVPMKASHIAVPAVLDAKWTLSNFTIDSSDYVDASAVAAASYAQRYIPGALQGHQHKVVVVTASISGTATNEVQTVGIDNASSGGTFTLLVEGVETGTIAFDAVAATVKSAIEAVSTATVAVTGGAGPTTDWIVEFQGTHAGIPIIPMVGDGSLLTGGTTVVTVTETTPGAAVELVVTMGGIALGSITAAGTTTYYIRPTDGLPLKFATIATSTTASITSVVVENTDPLNLDLIPETTAVQV